MGEINKFNSNEIKRILIISTPYDFVNIYNFVNDDCGLEEQVHHMHDLDDVLERLNYKPSEIIGMVVDSPRFCLDDDFFIFKLGLLISFNIPREASLDINKLADTLSTYNEQDIQTLENFYGKSAVLEAIKQILKEK